jgi:hypothetical protein
MKTTGYQRYKYTGDLYKFVREVIGDTSTLKYYFAGTVTLIAGIDKTQRMIIRSEQPFALGTIISNIKDATGSLILENTNWQINNLQPILNSFGVVESYRMTAIKYQGTL